MIKKYNKHGHCVLTAEKGKFLRNGEIYTRIVICDGDIDESCWTEAELSEVPVRDELTDSEALEIILGGAQ